MACEVGVNESEKQIDFMIFNKCGLAVLKLDAGRWPWRKNKGRFIDDWTMYCDQKTDDEARLKDDDEWRLQDDEAQLTDDDEWRLKDDDW